VAIVDLVLIVNAYKNAFIVALLASTTRVDNIKRHVKQEVYLDPLPTSYAAIRSTMQLIKQCLREIYTGLHFLGF